MEHFEPSKPKPKPDLTLTQLEDTSNKPAQRVLPKRQSEVIDENGRIKPEWAKKMHNHYVELEY